MFKVSFQAAYHLICCGNNLENYLITAKRNSDLLLFHTIVKAVTLKMSELIDLLAAVSNSHC